MCEIAVCVLTAVTAVHAKILKHFAVKPDVLLRILLNIVIQTESAVKIV